MNTVIKLYSEKKDEIKKFLEKYYSKNFILENDLLLCKEFPNPIEMAEIIGTFVENMEDFQINMWVSLDKDVFINITKSNANEFIKYLYERYPY